MGRKVCAAEQIFPHHIAGDLGESDEPDDEAGDEPMETAERVIPKPWQPAKAPYNNWGTQADAVPNKVLNEPKAKVPMVLSQDVKKYREGREGDEIGMKIGMKELHVKNKLSEDGRVQGQIDRDQKRKKGDRKKATMVKAEFATHEKNSKADVMKAAAAPEKAVVADAEQKQSSADVGAKREFNGRKQEIDDANKAANGEGM
jgi:hypothetical protein